MTKPRHIGLSEFMSSCLRNITKLRIPLQKRKQNNIMESIESGKKAKTSFFQPDIPVIISTTAIVVVALSIIIPLWWTYDPVVQMVAKVHNMNKDAKETIMTKNELAKYSAKNAAGKLYLAILGKVFDVSVGKQHYGKGGSYSFFTGIDGSRAFVSGDFNKDGLTDNIDGLKDEECLSLYEWAKFFMDEYTYVGKVVGNFYEENGAEKEQLKEFNVKLKRALQEKEKDDADKSHFPECNSKWTKEAGTEVWCTNESGGIKRDWTGVPRMFFKPGQTDYRCACVNEKNLRDTRLKQYPGCGVSQVSCKIN